MFGGSKFAKRGANAAQSHGSMLDGKPQRSSQQEAVNKKYEE